MITKGDGRRISKGEVFSRLSRRQRFYHQGLPWHGSERGLHIYAGHAVRGKRGHAAASARRATAIRNA